MESAKKLHEKAAAVMEDEELVVPGLRGRYEEAKKARDAARLKVATNMLVDL